MTYGNFKKYTAAFLQRTAASFVSDTTDILGIAINQARRALERMKDFEMSRTAVLITLNTDGSASLLSTAVLESNEATGVDVKSLKKAFIASSSGAWLPIDIVSRDVHVERVKRAAGSPTATNLSEADEIALSERYTIVRFGLSVYIVPAGAANYLDSATVQVKLDAIRWLADYSADEDTDFVLTYCPDLLLMQTVKWLNLSMREDERIPVSKEAFDSAWQAMEDWNRSIAFSDDDVDME